MTHRKQQKIMNGGDITLAALCHCQRASEVISLLIIFAVFDVSFHRYKLQINYSFLHLYLLFYYHGSTAGIFWSHNLCLSIMLLRTKFCVNQKINRPDVAEKRFSLWRPSAMLNLQNCAPLSCDRPWKRNLCQHTKLR